MKHFVAATAVRRSFQAGRRQIEKFNAAARATADNVCPCGKAKAPHLLVCVHCFAASPSWAKNNVYSRDAVKRKDAKRQILEVAFTKKTAPTENRHSQLPPSDRE